MRIKYSLYINKLSCFLTNKCRQVQLRIQRGFTLIELMVVVAILSVLSTIAAPSYRDYVNRVDIAKAIADINRIDSALGRYQVANKGSSPPDLATVGLGGLLDPWENPYQYLNLSNGGGGQARKDHAQVPLNSDYDLYSSGKDGASVGQLTAKASHDDIVRANNGRFVGLATDY
jgi:general secretion pathway protein G